jgi:hypothetical protein
LAADFPAVASFSMSSRARQIRLLATALTAGPMTDAAAMKSRALPRVGDPRRARWLEPLTRVLAMEFGAAPRPTVRCVAERIALHPEFERAWTAGKVRILPAPLEPAMAPADGAPRGWKLPEMTTLGALADFLRIGTEDLGWFISHGQATHYRWRWREKPGGCPRLIEMPKSQLKHLQRRILHHLLDAIPPHEAAHGFRRGSSVRDFIAPHTGRRVVLRFDVEDFFPAITAARVLRLWMTAGYPEPVARALTRLTTRATPPEVLGERPLPWVSRKRLTAPHLPQGAPTSPALANLCAFRLDCRLAGLAAACGADYTRYADDLLFSGGEDFAAMTDRFAAAVGGIAIEEGLALNHRKTRRMTRGVKQHAAGVVLNDGPNIDRRDYDRLKAILTNCVRHGPASQNHAGHADFAAHLAGRIGWVAQLHPHRGEKLRAIHRSIDWGA